MQEERQAVRDYFDTYNRGNAKLRGIQFDLIDWENHSTIGVDRPQDLITKQTLKKHRTSLALVIGLLGQRFGQPTGEYESGTEEEFNVAMAMRNDQGDYPEIKWFFREGWQTGGAPTDTDALAKGWLTSRSDDALSQEVCIDPVWWRETFLLAVLEQSKKPIFAMAHIKNMLEMVKRADESIRRQVAVLAGIGLMELRLTGFGSAAFSSEREGIRQKLIDIIENPQALTVVERAEAGRVLGQVGDPRPGVGLDKDGLPDIDWCEIQAGEITLDLNAGTFPVECFHMARYPVTNAQFQAFIDADDGYTNPEWWAKLDAEPEAPETPPGVSLTTPERGSPGLRLWPIVAGSQRSWVTR